MAKYGLYWFTQARPNSTTLRSNIIIGLSLITLLSYACSRKSADFSDVQVSRQAQAGIDWYEKVKDSDYFKQRFSKVLAEIPDKDPDDVKYPNELSVKGKVFSNAKAIMRDNWKISNHKFKESFGQNLSQIKSIPVSAVDFQLAQDILHDYLSASGQKKKLEDSMKKYTLKDKLRAARANLILSTIEFSASEQTSTSTSLALEGVPALPAEAAIQAAAEAYKAQMETAGKLIDNLSPEAWANAHKTNAQADLLEAIKEALRSCVETDLVPATTKWEECQKSDSATVDCNMGWSRNDPDFSQTSFSDFEGYSRPTFLGKNECGTHRYRCYCSQSRGWVKNKDPGKYPDPAPKERFDPKEHEGRWYNREGDTTGCKMIHADDASPKRPAEESDAEFNRALKRCEAKTNLITAAGAAAK